MHSERQGLVASLRSTPTIRERCGNILREVEAGRSPHFKLDRDRLADVAQLIEKITRRNYPDLRIPYHSRWRHFEAGGVDRKAMLDAQLAGRDQSAKARARIDLTLVSVLLDAGAGPQWRYAEAGSGQAFSRSEGLGVASFHAFMAGRFSSDSKDPLRVDAKALQRVDAKLLSEAFQVSQDNPLVGLEGRAALLRRLGDALEAQRDTFGADARPGALFDVLNAQSLKASSVISVRPDPSTSSGQGPLCGSKGSAVGTRVHPSIPQDERSAASHERVAALPAPSVLQALLDHFSGIWLAGNELQGIPLGDCWQHPHAGGSGATAGWVPFHKLSQWLTYSLLEPFEWAGITLTDIGGLTGLPEYRNGGLLLDAGAIVPRDAAFTSRTFTPRDEPIVEWRALTVALLDELAPLVRERLQRSADELPLACILEGGSWAAGRAIAKELRDGSPPLRIDSDGTVF